MIFNKNYITYNLHLPHYKYHKFLSNTVVTRFEMTSWLCWIDYASTPLDLPLINKKSPLLYIICEEKKKKKGSKQCNLEVLKNFYHDVWPITNHKYIFFNHYQEEWFGCKHTHQNIISSSKYYHLIFLTYFQPNWKK